MSKQRSALRNRAEFMAYRLARALTGVLPPSARSGIGGSLGVFYSLLGGTRREIIDFNLRLAYPDESEAGRRALARSTARHFGRAALDAISIQRLSPEGLLERVTVVGWEHVEGAMTRGKGAFFLTAHIGSWEVAALVTGLRLEHGLSVVNRPLDNPLLEAELDRLRRMYGNRVFGKRGIARGMISQLKEGGGIGILIDQRVPEDVGVSVPFFGHPVWTHPILARMVRRTEAPVVPVFSIRDAHGRYVLRYEAPVIAGELSAEELEVQPLTARFMAILESAIRKNPEQWLWYHDRWKHLRTGNSDFGIRN